MTHARLAASWPGGAIPAGRVPPARRGPTFAIASRSTP